MFLLNNKNINRLYRSLLKMPEPVLTDAHAKTGGHMLKLIIFLVIIAFFCARTLTGSSDKDLLITSTLSLPLKLGNISFQQFMVIGPLFLFFLSFLIQIYYRRYLLLNRAINFFNYTHMPVVSEVNSIFVKIINHLVLYTLVPLTMILFTYKSEVLPEWGIWMACVATLFAVIHIFYLFKNSDKDKLRFFLLVILILITISPAIIIESLYKTVGLTRPMNLKGVNLSKSNLTGLRLENANLEEADLQGARIWRTNLRYSRLKYATLTGAHLWRTDLSGASLQGADLKNAYLAESDLSDSNLEHANLYNANLNYANLRGANLKRAYLRDTNLEFAVMTGANFTGVKLRGSRVFGADMRATTGITQTMLDSCEGDIRTQIPEDLKRPSWWITHSSDEEP